MTLTLVGAPPDGTIVQHPSGLIVLRAEDFVGPARGDLTTAADSSSVVGTVVQETQALVVPSTFSGAGTGASFSVRWGLASDTLRIPVATLSPYLSTEGSFDVYVSTKVTGDVPSNARYKKTHSYYGGFLGGAAVGVAWGRDTTLNSGVSIVQTELWGDQYLMGDPLRIFWTGISAGTNLVMRAWGVTGGTIELSFDMIYLMPRGGSGTLRQVYGLSSFFPFDIGSSGSILADEDTDSTDNVIGEFSVGATTGAGVLYQELAPVDFQDAGDEPTVYDISIGRWDGAGPSDPLDPRTWVSFPAAPRYIPDTSLINETFAGAATGGNSIQFASSQGYIVRSPGNNFGGPGHPNGTSGWTRDGAGNLRCSIVRSSAVPGGMYSGTPHATLWFGLNETLSVGSTDPRDYQHTLWGLEDFTEETTFSADSSSDELNLMVGFLATVAMEDPGVVDLTLNGYGVVLSLTGGALTARLAACAAGVTPSFYTGDELYDFSSPISVDAAYAANTVYRVKIERRRYRVRAKVWLDGTGEPGTWDFDEYMPFRWTGSGGTGTVGWIDYPYNTNWSGNLSHDTALLEPWIGQRSMPGLMAWPNVTSPDQIVRTSEILIDIEPDGATPIDMLVAEENYDFTDRSNDLVIPYGSVPSARWVEGSLRTRHFGTDTNGFNVLGWKDGSGGPEMQASAFSRLYELAKIGGGILSLSHLRVANRYGTVTTVRG